MSRLEDNITKLQELQNHVHWAAIRWCKQCFDQDLIFEVREVYRSQKRQDELYAKGRWKLGKKVTWTLNSFHTQGLACDIYPINCSPEQIETVGKLYGITRPLAGAPLYDEWHYQFDNVGTFPIILRAKDKLRALQRRYKRSKEAGKAILRRVIKRLLRRSSKVTAPIA